MFTLTILLLYSRQLIREYDIFQYHGCIVHVLRSAAQPTCCMDHIAGVAALQSRQALIVDTVDAMTIQAYLRASGFVSDYSIQRSSTAIEQTWKFEQSATQTPNFL